MENAFRLLLHHATVMSFESTLIYGSALFTSAATFQPLVVEVNCNGGYRLCESSHELSAHSELVSAQMPKFKACLDFKPVVAWSPNSQYVAVSLVHGFEIRDALSGSIVDSFFLSPSSECVMDLQQVSCRCLAFFMDDSRVAWITRGGSIQVWNTLTKKVEFAVTVGEGLVSINVSPNGKLLVSGSKSGRIQVRNAKDGTLVWEVDTNTKLKSTSISPNSRFIVTLSFSCDGVRIWDADDEFLRTTLPHDVISASFSPDSDELATIDQEGVIRVWGMSRMSTDPIQEWRIDPQPVCLVFSPNGLQLAAAASENVHILHRDTDYVAMLNGHTGPVTSLAFSADGLTLTSGSLDMTIRVWDASSVKSSIFGLEKDKQEKWSRVCWSPRCHTVMAYGSLERKAQIWSTQDGAYRVLEGCWNDGGFPVAISDCGRYIAQRSKFGPWWQRKEMITTRRNTSDATQSNVAGHSDAHRIASGPYQYKFFPNSTRFAVVSGTKILTWDASVTCPEVTRLVGHSGEVLELHFVPDCSRLVSRARASLERLAGGWIDSG
ncbi:WD40-repeat-containing domain protein [Lactarius quietus]|nr:WD40-repeat-containing domain protein [Lactarius quietus]